MPNYVDSKYVLLYSPNLDGFKAKANDVYNFKCSECDDSVKKRRGYIYQKKNKFWYYCHNCFHSVPFETYLKEKDYNLYVEYLKEKFSLTTEQAQNRYVKKIVEVKPELPKFEITIPKILEDRWPHRCIDPDAYDYLFQRHIPAEKIQTLHFTTDFQGWTNTLLPGKFKEPFKESRIVIPFYDREGNFFGYQGRALDPNAKIRYITIMLDGEKPRIYGLNTVDFNRKHYVLEGPFDSMFLPNAISTAGGALLSELDRLGSVGCENRVLIYDNEPRNKNITDQMHKAVVRNCNIFIWPDHVQSKDVNQYVLEEGSVDDFLKLLEEHTYRGLQAELEFIAWRKC